MRAGDRCERTHSKPGLPAQPLRADGRGGAHSGWGGCELEKILLCNHTGTTQPQAHAAACEQNRNTQKLLREAGLSTIQSFSSV